MKLFVLFAAILVVGSFAQDLEEESEPSLCVEHQNPFKYAHCIKKRDTACQNGGFCGTCNENSCQTCNGNSCRTSCNGSGCNQCPNGNCCNGQNCNVCSGRSCCNGPSCNTCVNSCTSGCSTNACRTSCVQTCQGNNCCDKSDCFNTCRSQCFGDHCYEGCFKQCSCPETCNNPTPGPVIIPTIIYPNTSVPNHPPPQANQTIVVVNRPENKNPVNITTIVNLKNYISNKNIINTPINVTNINHNHINESQAPDPKPENIIEKCCIVVYPVHCYDIAEPPYKKCVQKRERKCGEICTSPVVHVVHIPGKDREVPVPVPYPVPGPVRVVHQPQPYPVPVVQRYPVPVYVPYGTTGGGCGSAGTTTTGGCNGGGYKQICHYINRYPWISCSHYGVQNCGSCYVCGGQYNPGYCSQQVSCAGLCRGNLVNFGNTWQNDILRFYNTQYGAQAPQVPAAQASADAQQSADYQQQAYVQQPAELPQGVGYVQQPAGGAQQFVVQQPYEMQHPFAGGQQYVAMQQPYMQPDHAQPQPAHVQQQPADFAG